MPDTRGLIRRAIESAADKLAETTRQYHYAGEDDLSRFELHELETYKRLLYELAMRLESPPRIVEPCEREHLRRWAYSRGVNDGVRRP